MPSHSSRKVHTVGSPGMLELEKTMSLGEDRVRVKFNPTDNSVVSQIKQKTAKLIDLCFTMPAPADKMKADEVRRLINLAMTHYEEAAMWAVKAATA
jgi:hypothetical protein